LDRSLSVGRYGGLDRKEGQGMSDKNTERDYGRRAIGLTGAVFGWVVHKLFSKEITSLAYGESPSDVTSIHDNT
jgi:hypothetical protein